MRAFAILVVALIGLVNCQNGGNANTYGDQGRPIGGGNSGAKFNTGAGGNPLWTGGQQGGRQTGSNGVYHANVGNAPTGTGGSSGRYVDVAPVVNTGPSMNNVNHQNAGAQPQGTGGSSGGLADIPLGPVQRGQSNTVNMANAGAAPVAGEGNSPNSGEYVYDYGVGAGGAVQGNGAAVNGQTGDMHPNSPQVAYNEAVLGAGAGGNSNNGGNPYNGGQFNAAGGAEISDFTQQKAGQAGHSSGAASVGGTAAGVIVAVLVLVGIVAVAAVFLIRQRRSRMTNAQV